MKISKAQRKEHNEFMSWIDSCECSVESYVVRLEKMNLFYPAAISDIGSNNAYFTPINLATDMAVLSGFSCIKEEGPDIFIIDICAGIGTLSFAAKYMSKWSDRIKVFCIEKEQKFVEIGRKIFPEAVWLQYDFYKDFDEIYNKLKHVIPHNPYIFSNPPFNINVPGSGMKSEWETLFLATKLSDDGSMIFPAGTLPYKLHPYYQKIPSKSWDKFMELTNNEFNIEPLSLDVDLYKEEWKGTAPRVGVFQYYRN